MNVSVTGIALTKQLLLPPFSLILLYASALLLQHRYPRLGLGLNLSGLVLLTVLSTKAGALCLAWTLEQLSDQSKLQSYSKAQAIVVLGGSASNELVRARRAVQLKRDTGLPLLITGPSNAMLSNMQDDYRVLLDWVERRATNTEENAKFTAAILKPAGVRRVFLVTDSVHMTRSKIIFEDYGFEVIPAQAKLYSNEVFNFGYMLPNEEGFHLSRQAIHEWMGIFWYWLRH